MAESSSRELQRLATIERERDGEQLRVSLDEFVDDRGTAHHYISARIWYQKDGQWCPTKKGLTIRQREIVDFGKALRAGLDGLNDAQRDQRVRRSG